MLFVISVFAICTATIFLFILADESYDKDFKLLLGVIRESVGVEETVNFFVNDNKEIAIDGLRREGDYYVYKSVKYKSKNVFVRVWEGIFGGEDEVEAIVTYRFKP